MLGDDFLGPTVSKVAQYRQYQGIGVILSQQASTADLMHIHQAIAIAVSNPGSLRSVGVGRGSVPM